MVASAETFRRRRRRRRLMLTSLLLAVITDAVVVVVDGQQPDSLGFISIDCGIPDGGGYSDESTRGLRYVPDAGFLDGGAGANAGINPPYTDRDLAARYLTVRYFPGAAAGERGGCYTLRRLSPGGRYLVRATFYYGDYDGAAATRLPVVFDLHVGVNRWTAVNVTAADAIYIFEAVVSPTADFLQVCLVNISLGTPLISGLDLRPLKAELYPEATANQSLLLLNQDRPPAKFAFNRYQFWRPASYYKLFRYKYDPYDRLWQPYGDDPSWTNITVAAAVDVTNITRSGDPSPILRSATTPANSSTRCLDFPWTSDSDADSLLLLYFAELQPAARRRFDVVVDGGVAVRRGYSPRYLAAEVVRATVKGGAAVAARRHVASLVASPDSTLPPLVNGLEIYTVQPMTELGTNDRDAKAMMAIRDKYELKKNWMGDPCAPKAFAWVGLNCTYASSVPAWITTLNLSSSVLTGPVDLPFGDLQSLQYLDLSNNSLSGPIPDFLAQMPSLKFLDLSSNNFSGLIPHNLLQKRQNGSLVLRIANNANLCDDDGNNACASENKQSKRILVIAIAVPIAVAILLFVAAILHLHRRLNNHETWMANNARLISPRERSNVFENRQFTYRELKLMTANFKEEIGQGGFGTVYLGYLEDGSPVAVKMCSKTSSQGDKEFIAEAQHLTRVHHRNLVSLIGYCKDKKHLALVYEYMHGGNLEDRLRGFISIDCGIAENTTYSDDSTRGLRYVSDFGFVDAGAGLNSGINPPYNDPSMAARYLTVRYFPIGASHRGCYTLRSLTPGGKYLLRSSFYYGNYDGENILPAFDLHLNGHLWATINVTSAGRAYIHEVIVVAPAGYLQVCVVDRGLGTPFISVLDLRPLAAEMYPEADAGHSLALLSQFRPGVALGFNRYHFWPADYQFYRYPFDPYDRIWQRFGTDFSWTNITTSDTINTTNISGEVPSIILQSAATPATNVSRIDISWTNSGDPSSNNNITYLLLLYFAELQRLPANALRQFDILVDNVSWNGSRGYVPRYLNAEAVSMTVQGSVQQQQHSVSLVATANATLPPILNAFEVYMVQRMTEFQTNVGEAKAMMAIRDKFGLKKNWAGDPCTPEAFYWDGLNCSYSTTGPAWITALNMKSNGLTGPIDASFGDLKSLQYLDLSSNDFSGSIPIGLLQKQQNGSLTLRTHNNPNLCSNGASNCEPKNKGRKRLIIISIVVPIFIATSVFAIVMLLLRRMRNKQDTWTENNSRHNSPRDGSNILENYRQFTYKELKIITVNFKEEIGQGGFGTVFLGYMDNETPVAVKMSSKKSSQGDKEFLAEARYLSRVHHRNLVCLIGFCKDKSHLGLVYEYMQGGNLEDRLRGGAFLDSTLTWHQRLKIALDSAHGLEYLHKSCRPPLIHRDVKTKNILLSANLEAKISDFGLTKVFTDEFTTHITTQPAGTLGYLDPEYYNTSRLSEKTDVYSFGVVLLEIITAQPPAVPINDTESIHIAQWVRQKLSEGNIESIADPRMGGEYDINSVWKVAELALNCKEKPSRERPSMTDVVAELKEGLELEVSHALGYCSSVTTSTNNLSATSVDLKTDYDETSDPRQQSVVELGQAGNASETHVQGPTPR
uniref:non-specific serine/threonine protein kinase n=1 Tax=Leersia perrieri TaxID=77586 RepID=A0A0D9Y0J3_9ORYZ